MLVKFVRSKSGDTLIEGTRDGDLVAGEVYPLLEIFLDDKGNSLFRICPPYNNSTLRFLEAMNKVNYNSDGIPAYYDSGMFDIIDNQIPPNWSVFRLNNSYFFRPKSWKKYEFWEAYFNYEVWAVELFKEEIDNIERFHTQL